MASKKTGKRERIRLLALPGVRRLEDFAVLRGTDSIEFEDRLHELCLDLFGEVALIIDSRRRSVGPPVEISLVPRYGNYVRTLSEVMLDDDIAKHLKRRGWDVTDERGQPLKITKPMAPTLECVSLGIWGKLPDMVNARAVEFGGSLAEEAAHWQAKRRRP